MRQLYSVAFVCLAATTAQAATFALAVQGLATCPWDYELKELVNRRLGHVPWADEAHYLAVVIFTSERDPAFAARVLLQDAKGDVLGEKTVRGDDCGDLGDTAALTLSLVMQDLESAHLAASAPAFLGTGATRVGAQQTSAKISTEPRRPFNLSLEGGPTFEAFTLPMAAFGAELGVSFQVSWFSFGIRGRVLAPLSYRQQSAVVNAVVGGTSIEACGNPSLVSLCALFQASAANVSATGLSEPRTLTAPLIATGIRVGVRLPTGGGFALRPHASLIIPLLRTSLTIDSANVWTAPPVAFGFGVDASFGWRFL